MVKYIRAVILLLFVFNGYLHAQTDSTSKKVDAASKDSVSKNKEEYTLPDAVAVDNNTYQQQLPLQVLMNAKKADKLFNDNGFADAIPYYEKVLAHDSTIEQVLLRLSDCYRLTNNLEGQLSTYGKLIRQGKSKPVHELYYGQALLQAGRDKEALSYFQKYSADNRGKNLAASFAKQKTYKQNFDAYAIKEASFNSKHNDICAFKYQDVIVFASTRAQSTWIARRQGWTGSDYLNIFATKLDAKGLEVTPKPFSKDLNTKFNDGPLCFNKDGSIVFYTCNQALKTEKAADGTFKLRILEGGFTDNVLTIVSQPDFVKPGANYAHPAISADGSTLYFASDQDGGLGGMDIYKSEKDARGKWGPAINLGEKINTAGNEVFPYIGPNEHLYFSSNGHDGLGGLDIYEVVLKNNKVFKIYNIGEPVNSKYDDFGLWLADDEKSGYFSSNRKNKGMDDDIYEVQILKPIKRGKDVLVITKDKKTGELVPNCRILVEKDTLFTNEKGEYATMIDEDAVIRVKTLKEDCFELKDTVSARASQTDAITKEFLLEPNPKLFLHGYINDAKTNEVLSGVNIRVTDINTGKDVDLYTTTSAGDYFKFLFDNRIGDQLAFLIKLEKKGYLSRSVIFNYTVEKPGEIEMNKIINMQLGKVEVGMDLGKLIDLKPIYFDVGKSTIRPDAAEELDKIIEVMNLYPEMFIELGSHTDCRGNAAANAKLSAARAKSSVDYIVKKGINKMRITSKGYGESKLLNDCACEGKKVTNCAEDDHAINRRTEFLITKMN